MNTTSNHQPTIYPPVPPRRWFQTGTYSFYLLCIVLLIIARATYWLVVKEYQTQQLYILAEQLGFTEDSQVLRTRDWYCTEWSPIGQQNCRVFLAYTTPLTLEQMRPFVKKVGALDAYDRSDIPEYVLLYLRTFVPNITYLATTSAAEKSGELYVKRIEWGLVDPDSSGSIGFHMYFYETANMSPPFLLAGKPIKENIVVLYGKAKTTWLF